jgi:hypothetical protein
MTGTKVWDLANLLRRGSRLGRHCRRCSGGSGGRGCRRPIRVS